MLGYSANDLIIAVMGITGSGKSTFISHLVDSDVTIGHDLSSCTMEIGIHSFFYKNKRRIYLIDTPGFDDTNRSDTDVLKDIAFFLTQTYKRTVKLAGIVYLHRVTDVRMAGSSLRNLGMFKKLCGEDAYQHVVLATTMWDELTGRNAGYETGVKREQELLSRKEWWGLMAQRGSKVVRHSNDKPSAEAIVSLIVNLESTVALDIQREMVDQGKGLHDTAAGQEVEREIQKLRREYAEHINELKATHQQALADRDTELADVLLSQQKEYGDKLNAATEGQEQLRISMQKLSEEKEKQYNELLDRLRRQEDQFVETSRRRVAEFDEESRRLQQRHNEMRAQQESEKEQLRRRMQKMDREHRKAESERVSKEAVALSRMETKYVARLREAERQSEERRAETERLRREQQDLEIHMARERARAAEEESALALQRAEMERQQQQESLSLESMTSIFGVLAGFGTAAAGVLTLNPGLAVMGLGMAGNAASRQ